MNVMKVGKIAADASDLSAMKDITGGRLAP
jgi:hypothetical protein